uniref:DUF4145 domain-containing protein n=1 Tax=uncultured Christiangramia sp. TaxID=503836 RepID=UPI0026099936|nr:DUF4145 domain-containing protein [uncultured Christiangramia sp.]
MCTVGARAIVEGICTDQEINDGPLNIDNDNSSNNSRSKNLQGKINSLFEVNKLTNSNAEILHEHRFLGKKAVHDLSEPTKDDLELVIEIIENFIEIYTKYLQKD